MDHNCCSSGSSRSWIRDQNVPANYAKCSAISGKLDFDDPYVTYDMSKKMCATCLLRWQVERVLSSDSGMQLELIWRSVVVFALLCDEIDFESSQS